uniref:Uncharacterized protein n=1 Tax=Anopheles atroparvus TaxID=41427 RepID=A0A182JI67_ANOAO
MVLQLLLLVLLEQRVGRRRVVVLLVAGLDAGVGRRVELAVPRHVMMVVMVDDDADAAAEDNDDDDADDDDPTERMTGVIVSPFCARCCAVPPMRSSSADEPELARCRMMGHAPERDDDDEDVSVDSVLETELIGLLAISTSTWLPSQLQLAVLLAGLFASDSTAPWSSSFDHICWRSSSLCSVRNTTSFSVCSVLSVRRSGMVRSSSCMNSGLSGRFCVITVCRHAFSFVYMRSISSTLRRPGRSGVISTIAQNRPISASVRCIEFIRSAKLNVESTRKRAFAPFWMVSRRITCPLRQMMELIVVSNMQISRTNSASNRPAFSSVNLSSCVSSWKPGIMPAKSITPRMTCANLWLNSCSDCSSGAGFNGHACNEKGRQTQTGVEVCYLVLRFGQSRARWRIADTFSRVNSHVSTCAWSTLASRRGWSSSSLARARWFPRFWVLCCIAARMRAFSRFGTRPNLTALVPHVPEDAD